MLQYAYEWKSIGLSEKLEIIPFNSANKSKKKHLKIETASSFNAVSFDCVQNRAFVIIKALNSIFMCHRTEAMGSNVEIHSAYCNVLHEEQNFVWRTFGCENSVKLMIIVCPKDVIIIW